MPLQLEAIQERYDREVFQVLASYGIERAELDLAWDFTTGSVENATRDVLDVRQGILDTLEPDGPAALVLEVHEPDEGPMVG